MRVRIDKTLPAAEQAVCDLAEGGAIYVVCQCGGGHVMWRLTGLDEHPRGQEQLDVALQVYGKECPRFDVSDQAPGLNGVEPDQGE